MIGGNLKLPCARVADVERHDAVDADPVAVVALRRALRVRVLDRREASVRMPELGVAGAVGHACLGEKEDGISVSPSSASVKSEENLRGF